MCVAKDELQVATVRQKLWERTRLQVWVFPKMGARKSRFPLLISTLQLLITNNKPCSI